MFRFAPALWRYRWLVLGITAAGFGAGWSALPPIAPQYEAHATIGVAAADASALGPIQPTKLSSSGSWLELLRTEQLLSPVVREFHLARRSDAQSEREAVESLAGRLRVTVDGGSDLLRVSLVGSDPERTATVLNAVVERFVSVATYLKMDSLSALASNLDGQRVRVEQWLRETQQELERYRSRHPKPVPRTVEEEALERRVRTAKSFYYEIQLRHETALLAAARSMPDLRLLDPAVPPHRPLRRAGPTSLLLLVIVISLCVAVADAVLLDWLDRRLENSYRV